MVLIVQAMVMGARGQCSRCTRRLDILAWGLAMLRAWTSNGYEDKQLAAELATDQKPSVDATPFRASRFSDGSPIVIGPEI
jgi:hypothetical protein